MVAEFVFFENVAALVEQWLDEAAKSLDWIRHKDESRQLSLFKFRSSYSQSSHV